MNCKLYFCLSCMSFWNFRKYMVFLQRLYYTDHIFYFCILRPYASKVCCRLYIYIYILEEYISRYLKDDLQWCTVFISDFRLLYIISAPTVTPTWVRNFQATSVIALFWIFLKIFLGHPSDGKYACVLLSALANGKCSFSHPQLYKEIYTLHLFHLIINSRMPNLVCSSCQSVDLFLNLNRCM